MAFYSKLRQVVQINSTFTMYCTHFKLLNLQIGKFELEKFARPQLSTQRN